MNMEELKEEYGKYCEYSTSKGNKPKSFPQYITLRKAILRISKLKQMQEERKIKESWGK